MSQVVPGLSIHARPADLFTTLNDAVLNIEFILYPALVALPGIAWFVTQTIKRHQTEQYKTWRLVSKLLISVFIMLNLSAAASYFVFALMLGPLAMHLFLFYIVSIALIYFVTVFTLGQWIQATRLGSISVLLTLTAALIYLIVIKPIQLVQPLAEKDIATAQYLMGYFYETGFGGVAVSDKLSAGKWYGKAGKQGYIRAARAAVGLLPTKNADRVLLLKLLAAKEPTGRIYYDLWQSTYFMPYASAVERKNDAEQWLNLAAAYGNRNAIFLVMNDKYGLESSCRLSPKSYEALPEFERWLDALENNRDDSESREQDLQELKARVDCLAKKVAAAKLQDAQLDSFIQALFSTDIQTQARALSTLKSMGPRAKSAIPSLLQLAQSKNYSTAWNALGVIHKIDPQGALVTDDIMAMLSSPTAHIRVNAAYGVGLYSNVLPQAMEQLDKLLQDPSREVAGRAALALSEYGASAMGSLTKIETLTKSRDSRLSSYARQAYSKIKYGK